MSALLSLAVATGVLGLVPGTAEAGSLPYTVQVAPVSGLTSPNSLASAGGLLFVADTNAVQVLDTTGALVRTIPGLFGAKSVTAAPDGSVVYVAESTASKIATIDVATLTTTAEVTVSDCPTSLAVTATTVYYSSGCETVGEINHVDRASGTANDLAAPDATGFYAAPSLRADSSRLYALDYFGDLSSWPLSDAGLGTVATAPSGITSQNPDWAVGGGRIVITNMGIYGYTLYDASTLSKLADVPATAYPRNVGFSPSGATFVGGVQNNDVLWAFDSTTAQLTGKAALSAADANVWPAGTGVAFSADGSLSYMLGSLWNGDGTYHYSLITGLVGTPQPTSVAVAAVSPTKYGAATTFVVTGTPNRTATVTVTTAGVVKRYRVALSATGRGVVAPKLLTSGTATATVDGDLTHTGFVSGAVAYRVPSLVQVVMSRGHKTVHGIVYYARPALARQVVRVLAPAGGRAVAVTLWRQSGRRWIAVMTRTVRTTSTGYAATYLVSGAKAVSYRITYVFRGDARNGKGSGATAVFRIG